MGNEHTPVYGVVVDNQGADAGERRFPRLRQKHGRDGEVHHEVKRRALAWFTLYPDPTVHQVHEIGGDGEPQASASVLPGCGAVGLSERLEDRRVLFARNSRPGITD